MVTDNAKDADNYRIMVHLNLLYALKKSGYKVDELMLEKVLHNLDKYIGLPTLRRGDEIEENIVQNYGKKLYDKLLEIIK